ncbi:MAG: CPBP family intramembrane metalloprotease [Planctomycetes bacterium]|nr:CPBP family intramembrane metalloprotease [Planctomycetota bacterium]
MKKKDNNKYSTSQLFNFAQGSYFERTSRPIYAIIFLLPFIIFYELGTIFINTDALNQIQVRVVAFVWLQHFLEYLGFGSKLIWMAPALAVILILLGLQLTSRKKWQFFPRDIGPMSVECTLLAIPLIVLSLFLSTSAEPSRDVDRFDNNTIQVHSETIPNCSSVATVSLYAETNNDASDSGFKKSSLLTNMVTGIGAGIYEELVFRLVLICLLMIFFQDLLRLNHRNSVILAVLVSAALFSAHHHIIFLNGRFGQTAAFNWTEFSFRTLAGIYFAVLFAIRGFGITAGTHAFYDIIATATNAMFFEQ